MKIHLIFLFIFLSRSISGVNCIEIEPNSVTTFDENEPNYTYAPTCDLVTRFGYPCERHTVTTEDGYILELHRISNSTIQFPNRVVLIGHGFWGSSADFVIQGPDKALGFLLFAAGYDVWLGNNRGNRYSNKHVKYTQTESIYWDFSFSKLGCYDNPAMIDYIISATGEKRIDYIGYSQGCSSMFATLSVRPDYNNKIKLFSALAPAVFFGNTNFYMYNICAELIETEGVNDVVNLFGNTEFTIPNFMLVALQTYYCNIDNTSINEALCHNVWLLTLDYNSSHIDPDLVNMILGHTPAGASAKEFVHFCQLKNSKTFQKYDYGFLGNLFNYGTSSPPQYNLQSVSVPVIIYSGKSDIIVVPQDVEILVTKVPNLRNWYQIPDFTHTDFTVHMNANVLVYNSIVSNMIP